MKNKITYWALGILAGITICSAIYFLVVNDPYAGVGFMMVMMLFAGIEIILLLFLSLAAHLQSRSENQPTAELKERSKRFLLAALLVLLVGFSVCFSGGVLIGG